MRKPPIKVELKDKELLELISEEEERWFNSLSAEELAKHGGKYIATKNRQIIASSESLGGLYRQLEVKGIQKVCISYIDDPRLVVIY
ncbi:hypothetical protein FJZ31_31465 [Candidatus Poribacteria bacterium]|nr:hypothetical protein [Candidatus Poribacteria bacterium]